MWQQVLGHMVSLVRFLPRGRTRMHPLQWLQEDKWLFGVPLQVPSLSLSLYTGTSLSGWGMHLLDLTASGVWSEEENAKHSSVLEMKVVSVSLAAFLPQLSGRSVILMSNNALVVAYLRYQDGAVSRDPSHGLRDHPVDPEAFCLPVDEIHSGEEEHSGRPAQPSRPCSSHGMVPSSAVCSDIPISSSLPPKRTPSFLCMFPQYRTHWPGSRMHSSILGTICLSATLGIHSHILVADDSGILVCLGSCWGDRKDAIALKSPKADVPLVGT